MSQSQREPKATKQRQPRGAANKDHLSLAYDVKPMTEAQRQMMFAYQEGMNVVAYGSAGTGKSFIACYLALKDLFAKKINKIVIIRSAVETRSVGFLPGDLAEKTEPYMIPYKQIINQLCHNGTSWDIMIKKGMVEFITTSYVRGITIENCTIIVDEFQNMNPHEAYSVLSRIGENCQIVLCGDTKQTDLNKKKEESCFDWVYNVSNKMPKWFDMVHFYPNDIVRSGFVKDLIVTVEGMA
jgi:phosphate starvation-inducible PhoH-like protein